MTKAFVFGKFLPFHKGHEAMINFALTKCDFLTILICCGKNESIGQSVRVSWIEKSVEALGNVEIRAFDYDEDELPSTSVSSRTVSEIWAKVFLELMPDHTMVVTSEPYGDFLADFMKIRHVMFDLNRKNYPISASGILNDLHNNWHFLPTSVKPYFSCKVVILGTESTGKTTLAKRLSEHYACELVVEAGRDIIADSNVFTFEDLTLVANEHARRISEASYGKSLIMIVDTDIHITMSYARFAFNSELSVSRDIYAQNKGNLYLYLNNDVPHFQDGTRYNEIERNLLDHSHRRILAEHKIQLVEILGDWESRFETAVEQIDRLLSTMYWQIN